jgi:4-amino-4-deoxy-L-arabinose transferase-like glycosyltransferase
MTGARRPPAPLVALLVAAALLGVCWAFLTPPFQAPDENAHVAYVQSLAELGELPGAPERSYQSTEQATAAAAANSDQTAQVLATKPEWNPDIAARWLAATRALPAKAREDGGGTNPASPNPPLYYLLEAGAYEAASGSDFFARVTAMRLLSVLFLLITVAGCWLLAGEVFGPRRDLQVATAAVPALLPMMTFISSSVTPDALVFALWSLGLWLGVRVLKGRDGLVEIAALLLVTGLAIVTKATSYALLPAAVFVLAVAAWRRRELHGRVAAMVACAVVALAVTVGTWYVIARAEDRPAAAQITGTGQATPFNARQFTSYVWEYYLPRLPFQAPYGTLHWPPPQAYETWFRQSIGAFGWLETRWPKWVYVVAFLLALAIAAAAATTLWRRRRTLPVAILAFFALAGVVMLFGLHWTEFRLGAGSGALSNQGRYLFPLIGVFGLVAGCALLALPERARQPALGVFVGGLLVMQLFSIGLVATRFYA